MKKKEKYEDQFSINQMLKDGIEISYFFLKKKKKSIFKINYYSNHESKTNPPKEKS